MDDRHRLEWRKSSHSTAGGNCVEVARLADGRIGVRDSKHPDAGPLVVTQAEFGGFIQSVRAGEFGHLA
jgi:Domain of unknown function (DUF397).